MNIMNRKDFYKAYIDIAYNIRNISQIPAEIEQESKLLKQKCHNYVGYLKKFENHFDTYPTLKKELLANLTTRKIGAFIEYQLDICFNELTEIEKIMTDIDSEITALQSNFTNETRDWLPEEANNIVSCFEYLEPANTQVIISFLNTKLKHLKEKKAYYQSEKEKNIPDFDRRAQELAAQKIAQDKAAQERAEREKAAQDKEAQEKAAKKQKAWETYLKQMKNVKK